jgi:CubicO group peptidase (beta-lactamase class C family)
MYSMTKPITSTALLMLFEEGRFQLTDPLSKYFPAFADVKVLTGTSPTGQMLLDSPKRPITIQDIFRQTAGFTYGYFGGTPVDKMYNDANVFGTDLNGLMTKLPKLPLLYQPGEQWVYSVAHDVQAALVEKLSGQPFDVFVRQRIFTPLGMTSATDFDAGPLDAQDAEPLLRHALGPLRRAPKEGKGWLFGAGHLAMTARDLAVWDIAVLKRSLLKPASYQAQQTDMLLRNGLSTRYGLGVSLGTGVGGVRRISHGGAVSGYTTTNDIYPDQNTAVVVFTNIYPGAAGATGQIAGRVAGILFAQTDSVAGAARDLARRIYDGLAKGSLDAGLFTDNAKAYFSPAVIADYQASLGPLGAPTEFVSTGESLRGGMTIRSYRIRAGSVVMDLTTMTLPDGRIEQYLIARAG